MNKKAYLTIDDGPTEETTLYVDFLNEKQIQAIWFCQGRSLEKYPDQAIYAIHNGQVLGNHSYDHTHFSDISINQAKEQIKRTDEIIDWIYTKAGVVRPTKIFRFPHLDNGSLDEYEKTDWSNPHVSAIQSYLRELNYSLPIFQNITYNRTRNAGFLTCVNVDCTYDSMDWCLEDGVELFGYHDLPTILARVDEDFPEEGRGINYPYSNDIIMMHADKGIEGFKPILNKIESKGITFILPKFAKPLS
jgi:peptidoglycan/xylan/chitin deacetylase (PgdA/CDA1 family)